MHTVSTHVGTVLYSSYIGQAVMAFDHYTKQWIPLFFFQGYRTPTISRRLDDEGILVSRRGVTKFHIRYLATRFIAWCPGSGRRTKVMEDVRKIVDEQMRVDDETTATQFHVLLTNYSYSLSLCTILHSQMTLGWIFQDSAYCQLVHDTNKKKQLKWDCKYKNYNLANIVFTDESSVQYKSHCQFCCWKGISL